MCNIILFFNNGTDQVALLSALNFVAAVSPMAVIGGVGAFLGASGSCVTTESTADDVGTFLYECDFWTPNFKRKCQ